MYALTSSRQSIGFLKRYRAKTPQNTKNKRNKDKNPETYPDHRDSLSINSQKLFFLFGKDINLCLAHY